MPLYLHLAKHATLQECNPAPLVSLATSRHGANVSNLLVQAQTVMNVSRDMKTQRYVEGQQTCVSKICHEIKI
jgi:hypothetical protein